MKIRDDILLVEQGMGSVSAASTDKWGVAYHQVAEGHPSDRKIPVVSSSTYGIAGWDVCSVLMTVPGPLGDSMAFGASMPCGAGTSIIFSKSWQNFLLLLLKNRVNTLKEHVNDP